MISTSATGAIHLWCPRRFHLPTGNESPAFQR